MRLALLIGTVMLSLYVTKSNIDYKRVFFLESYFLGNGIWLENNRGFYNWILWSSFR